VLAEDNTFGTITAQSTNTLTTGVTYQQTSATNSDTTQNINNLSFNATSSNYMVLPYYGTNLFSRHTLSNMVGLAQADGYTVVGAINGDFFNVDGTVTGMPVGPVIQNDRVVCSEEISPNITGDKVDVWKTIGFKRNGSAVLSHLTLAKTMTVVNTDGTNKSLQCTLFNRKLTSAGVHIYTSDFGSSVQNTDAAYAVVLSVTQGDFSLDETVVCSVDQILPSTVDMTIPKGKVVLCIKENDTNSTLLNNTIKGLTVGQRVDLTLSGGDRWSGVYQAISGPDAVLSNGTVTTNPFVKVTNYPSTIVGVKSDGTCVMVQIDGRGMGGSHGVSAIQCGTYMKSLGCVNALMFDGGGSSEMVGVINGTSKVFNNPSDGSERQIGTSLLIVQKTDVYNNPTPIIDVPSYGTATTSNGKNYTGSDKTNSNSGSISSGSISSGSISSDDITLAESIKSVTGTTDITDVPIPEEGMDYPDNNILNKRFLKQIYGLNKGLVLNNSKSVPAYTWNIVGNKLTQNDADMNLEVSFTSEYSDRFDELSNNADGILLSFAQEVVFPGVVYLTVPINFTADVVQVYGYDAITDSLYLLEADVCVTNQTVTLPLSTADNLLLTTTRLAEVTTRATTDTDTTPVGGSSSQNWIWIIIVGVILLLVGCGITLFIKKQKNNITEHK